MNVAGGTWLGEISTELAFGKVAGDGSGSSSGMNGRAHIFFP